VRGNLGKEAEADETPDSGDQAEHLSVLSALAVQVRTNLGKDTEVDGNQHPKKISMEAPAAQLARLDALSSNIRTNLRGRRSRGKKSSHGK